MFVYLHVDTINQSEHIPISIFIFTLYESFFAFNHSNPTCVKVIDSTQHVLRQFRQGVLLLPAGHLNPSYGCHWGTVLRFGGYSHGRHSVFDGFLGLWGGVLTSNPSTTGRGRGRGFFDCRCGGYWHSYKISSIPPSNTEF